MPWHITPSVGNVLVEPQTEEEIRTESGLVVIHQREEETHICEVLVESPPYEAVASDRSIQRAGPIYPKGTLVVVGKYNGRDIEIRLPNGSKRRLIILRESDVLGTLEQREDGFIPDA